MATCLSFHSALRHFCLGTYAQKSSFLSKFLDEKHSRPRGRAPFGQHQESPPRPEIEVLGADQKERGRWGRE